MIRSTFNAFFRLSIMGAVALACFAPQAIAKKKELPPTQIKVETKPTGARIAIDGVAKGSSPIITSNITSGKHVIEATKKGFKKGRRIVLVPANQVLPVHIDLKPITGLMLIHTDPQDATIQIDGIDRGQSPALLMDISLGQHIVKFTKVGYLDKEIEVFVKSRAPMRIDKKLSSSSAILSVTSIPDGAQVLLNGTDKGRTPCRIDGIPEGLSKLTISAKGFDSFTQEIKLSAGQDESVNATLKAIRAKLRIESAPTGAKIYVDNMLRGNAPVELALDSGDHRIRADLVGFESVARTVTLENGEEKIEELRLDANCGQIQITTEPAGITVFVNGNNRGKTKFKTDDTSKVSEPLLLDMIPEGTHDILLTDKGHYDVKFRATVFRKQTGVIHKKLARRFIPNIEVRLKDGRIYTGILVEKRTNGDLKVETKPGVFKTLKKRDIRTSRPLRDAIDDMTK